MVEDKDQARISTKIQKNEGFYNLDGDSKGDQKNNTVVLQFKDIFRVLFLHIFYKMCVFANVYKASD